MAERSRDRSSSSESQPKFPECSHFRRRNDNHRRCQQYRLNDGLPLCTQDSPWLGCKDWLPEAWTAQAKRNRCKAAAAAAAKAVKKESEIMDDSVELHAPRDAFPFKCTKSEDSSKAKRSKTATSSSQPKSVASGVTAVGRPSSYGSDLRRSRMPERKRRHGEEKRHESPRHQSSRCDGHSSDRRESERARPSSSGGASSRRRAESGSVSKASDTRPSGSSSRHHHHTSGDRRSLSSSSSRASPDRKSQPSHRERRRESSDRTGGTFVARRDVQLSPAKSKAPEKRTITVVASPVRRIHVESAPEVPVPAPVADGSAERNGTATGNDLTTGDGSATGNGPATGDGSATGNGPATGDGSATVDGPTTVDDTANDNPADVSMVESSHSSQLRFDDTDDSDGPAPLPAVGVHGSAGQGNPAAMPVGGPDVSSLTGTSTPPLFPSIPKTINQSTLVDFMSLWTLLQRRLDLPSVPDNSISPAVQSSLPVPGHDSTNRRSATPAGSPERRLKSPERFLHTPQSSISSLVRRAKEAERQARTPVRPPRTPVRQSRNHSESRDSRSPSPLSRSSSVESTARDESPLNFNAALNVDSKRALSEDEDAEGDSKKISAAQYEIFRQAVTSKGTYKINPAKTKRAARASLLDLGDTEVPDRVSWLDQPSLHGVHGTDGARA